MTTSQKRLLVALVTNPLAWAAAALALVLAAVLLFMALGGLMFYGLYLYLRHECGRPPRRQTPVFQGGNEVPPTRPTPEHVGHKYHDASDPVPVAQECHNCGVALPGEQCPVCLAARSEPEKVLSPVFGVELPKSRRVKRVKESDRQPAACAQTADPPVRAKKPKAKTAKKPRAKPKPKKSSR